MLQLLTGMSLEKFIPRWTRPTRDSVRGSAMMDVELDPLRDRKMLRFVCDEDGLQNRAIHFMFSFVGLRGAITPEVSHPKWNSFKRACSSAGLDYDLLRLTLASNYGHGTRITGERRADRQQYLHNYLLKQTLQYFLDLKEEIMLDRQMPDDSTELDPQLLLEEFLECPSIKRKGAYVPCLTFPHSPLQVAL